MEYNLRGLTQAQVNSKAGLTFATGLRSMLRQDPDIIMVGEIRDSETAVLATEAALTGHLVFSTLHTNDASGAVARLLEMGIEPFLVASSLVGILAQRLLRTVCPRCKEDFVPPESAVRRLGLDYDPQSPPKFARGRGCDACRRTGYRGRTGVFEFLMVNDDVRDLIIKETPSHVIAQSAVENGMVTLREDAVQKVSQGITTIEEALTQVYGGR